MSLALGVSAQPKLELPELAEQTKPSVVHLVVYDVSGREAGSGTGFFIDTDRVATNEHVIGSASKVKAKLPDGRVLEVTGVLAADREKDIAVIEVTGANLPPALKLGASRSLRQGDEVVVIGSPRGLAGTLSTGIISALRGDGIDGKPGADRHAKSWNIQITAAISPGSSGSPIMTRDGVVIAVAVGIVGSGGNLGFGVAVEELKAMLDRVGPEAVAEPFAASSGGSALMTNLTISGVFFVLLGLAFFVPGFIKRRRKA